MKQKTTDRMPGGKHANTLSGFLQKTIGQKSKHPRWLIIAALFVLLTSSTAVALSVVGLTIPRVIQFSKNIATKISSRKAVASIAAKPINASIQQQKGAANLDQARNGSQTGPVSPVDFQNGNAGSSNSHYVEGQSIPYRAVLTDLPVGASITLTLGFDIKHSGKHAIDYLTSYNRLQPHFYASHSTPENVDPLAGLSGTFSAPMMFPLPPPSSIGSPMAGQPSASFSTLSDAEKQMTIFNGTISSITYLNQGDLNATQSEATINVTFTPSSATAVLAWGGHIGSRADWGFANGVPMSAGGVSGSPYHMRLKDWVNNTAPPELKNLGNQDRSLSADAVVPPPTCGVTGTTVVCANSINTYNATTDATNPTYAWTLVGNTSGAAISGSASGSSVTVNAGANQGEYTIRVTITANGFSSECSTKVTVSPTPTTVASNNGPVCDGGTIQLSATGDAGDSYSWTGPNGFTSSLQNPTIPNATAAVSGVYSVVRTASGCSSAPATTTVNQPPPLSLSETHTNVSCHSGNTGAIDLSVSGGTEPYTYSWTGGATTQDIANLVAGDFTVVVTDKTGCSTSKTITITQPTALTMDATATAIACFGGDATVTVTASGGTAPYSGTGTFTVKAGTHSYTVTDANQCKISKTITVTEPTLLNASSSATPILCNGGTSIITVGGAGGTAPYTGTGTFTVTAGNYTYTVTDANGCTATTSITVTEPPALTMDASATAIACAGGNATVTVTAGGGTAPYSGTGSFPAKAGTHTYQVTDANGCTISKTITITEPAQLEASSNATTIFCNGGTSTITVGATGGTAPYSGIGTFTVGAGTHSYTVTDANGCTATTSVTVTQPSALTMDVTATPISCFGGDSTVTVTANGGTDPYTGIGTFTVKAGTYEYTVTDANGCSTKKSITVSQPTLLTASSSATEISCFGGDATVTVKAEGGTAPHSGTGTFPAKAGTHSYTVTDANGCTATTSITITEPPLLTASSTATEISCFGGEAFVTVSATGGSGSYTGTGTFTVKAGTHDYTVTDANGCKATTSITIAEPAELNVEASASEIACFGGEAMVSVKATGGTAPYTGTGDFKVKAGRYTYTVTDAKGCTKSVTIIVNEPSLLTASSTATPIVCNGGTSTITVAATGGTAPYQGIGTFTVTAGTYNYTVTDAKGCATTTSITVTEPPPVTIAITGPTEVCIGNSVTLTATAGFASYLWSNGATTSSITVSPTTATTYSVTVANASGCSASASWAVATKDCLLNLCSYTQGGWGATPNGNNPAMKLATNFALVFPSGIEVGIAGASGYSMLFTSATGVMNYLPAGGPARALNSDATNPLTSNAGVFGGQVLALEINVAMSDKLAIPAGYGDLFYTGTGSLNGKKVREILAAMETALGGGALPSGYNIAGLNGLATNLNEALDNCTATTWALANLRR